MNNTCRLRVAHLQPFVPHYREEFFCLMGGQTRQDIFTYDDMDRATAMKEGRTATRHIGCLKRGPLLVYNPLPLLRGHDVLVLMLHFGHLTTWLLLLTKWLHRRKIVLWGQGISVKRYLKEERRPDRLLRWMIALSDGAWIYMEKEARQWQRLFPRKPIVALKNTLSGAEAMTTYRPRDTIGELKAKYGIRQETVLLYCARFTPERRADLLTEAIAALDAERYAFVIIGGGASKPDFSIYNNVYDFGTLYDDSVKRELFALADIYFQPGWMGLSVVEAMASGLPVFTFRRTRETLQCVEYSYIEHMHNGFILDTTDYLRLILERLTKDDLRQMGDNGRRLVAEELTGRQMAERAMSIINAVS